MADISKITLPSGNTYDIKDATARQAISGGVSFIVAWDGESAPTVADVPAGVKIKYNSTTYTGTLAASSATPGAFYLIKSSTSPSSETLDIYDEYVPVEAGGVKAWEKIGDTKLDLDDIVVDISTTNTNVIGSNATLSHTNPTVSLNGDAASGTDYVNSGTTKYMEGTASGVSVAFNNTDSVTALTGLGTPSTQTVLKGAKPTENSSTTGLSNYIEYIKSLGSATTKKLAQSTENFVKSRTSQTTAKGTFTVVNPASPASTADANSNSVYDPDECILVWPNVSNETLILRAGTLDTQTTYQADSPTSVTYATGAVGDSGNGSTVVTAQGTATTRYLTITADGTANAVTGYASPTTDTVIGTDATFSVTQPTIALEGKSSAATGRAQYVESLTSKKLATSVSGGGVSWNNKDQKTVITSVTATKGTDS